MQEWKGDWSDASAKLTPEIMRLCNHEAGVDGIFLISFEDYLKFFYVTTICKFKDDGDLSVIEDEH